MLVNELRTFDTFNDFKQYLRMDEETFNKLLSRVRPYITKQTTHMRKPIAPEQKLAITLRYLATGEEFESLVYQYRIHSTTIAAFVPHVCQVIYTALQNEYMCFPENEEEWLQLAHKTFEQWQFPNTWGAIDGKHVRILHPAEEGSTYYCYKGFDSIVLLGVVSYDYKFLYVNVGCQGRIRDGGVFRATDLCEDLETNSLGLPDPRPLPVPGHGQFDPNSGPIPFLLVGDQAFSLSPYLMKPYKHEPHLPEEKKIFNYRLTRFRRISENGFGILVNRFRLWLGRCNMNPEIVRWLHLASVALHNLLCTKSRQNYFEGGFADHISENGDISEGAWRNDGSHEEWLLPLSSSMARRYTGRANDIRNRLATYFLNEGNVPWQWKNM